MSLIQRLKNIRLIKISLIILLIFIAILLAGFIAPIIKQQHGFVIVGWNKITIETRLWLAATLLLISYVSVWLLSWLYFSLTRSLKSGMSWFQSKGAKRSRNQTVSGFIALTEGHWEVAENHFRKASSNSEHKLINYLLAAKAAHEQNNPHQRDLYLKEASRFEPNPNIAVSVTQAELQYDSEQYEQALATLMALKVKAPKHPYILKLLARCYYQLKDWENLYALLPDIKKLKLYSTENFAQLQHECLNQILIGSAQKGCEALQQQWQQIRSEYRKDSAIITCFARLLIESDAHTEAEVVLRSALKRHYDGEMIYWYARAATVNNASQLTFAESFSGEKKSDGNLYFALGLLAFKNELWGKAKSHLQQAIHLKGPIESYILLAETHQQMGETQESQEIIKRGLGYSVQKQSQPLLGNTLTAALTHEDF